MRQYNYFYSSFCELGYNHPFLDNINFGFDTHKENKIRVFLYHLDSPFTIDFGTMILASLSMILISMLTLISSPSLSLSHVNRFTHSLVGFGSSFYRALFIPPCRGFGCIATWGNPISGCNSFLLVCYYCIAHLLPLLNLYSIRYLMHLNYHPKNILTTIYNSQQKLQYGCYNYQNLIYLNSTLYQFTY